jgi:hypothetical protein
MKVLYTFANYNIISQTFAYSLISLYLIEGTCQLLEYAHLNLHNPLFARNPLTDSMIPCACLHVHVHFCFTRCNFPCQKLPAIKLELIFFHVKNN